MLLREDGDAVVAIGQASHAWVSGQLARAWGNERFGDVEPREEVCLAADQHDVGMAHWDLTPALHPQTGRPLAFTQMPRGEHVRLWSLAPARLLTQSRYAALLVSLHGTGLYQHVDVGRLPDADADAVRAYLAGQRALQARLAAEVGATPAELERNRRLLAAWDALSLALCLRWAPYTHRDVPAAGAPVDVALEPDGSRFTLEPWPLRGERVVVRCEGRRLEGRFEREADLHDALERAPRAVLEFELVPARAAG